MSNRAAFRNDFNRDTKLVVGEAPFPRAGPNTIVVRNRAVATNPIDWILRDFWPAFLWMQKPIVSGIDAAGEVVEVGPNVTRFKVGDRVMAYCRTLDYKLKNQRYAGFQEYIIADEGCAAHVPDDLSFEEAAAVPLGCFTASVALFDKLALDRPTVPPRPKNGKVVIVWSGASSVGVNAIQLAAAAGYDVYTTASPKNNEYLAKLGATKVFDYRNPNLVNDIVAAIGEKPVVGAVAVQIGSTELCIEILSKTNNAHRKVVMVSQPVTSNNTFPVILIKVIGWAILNMLLQRTVKLTFADASAARHGGLGAYVFHEFLPQAFASGDFVAAPKPLVVGSGLESIQTALELHQKGVSAAKPVVSLP